MYKKWACTAAVLMVLASGLECCMGRAVGDPVSVEILPLQETPEFPDAFDRDSLGFACADREPTLRAFFLQQGLSFHRGLLRETDEAICHIYYQPTIRGFRAVPDNQPITEVFFDINGLSFLTRREVVFGDGLDAVKQILQKIPGPLDVTLGLSLNHDGKWYERAKEFHLGNLPHRIQFRDNQLEIFSPWPQDYLKSGQVGSELRIMLARRVFEREGPAHVARGSYQPMLDEFPSERLIRSKLSWEGGDLQFVRDPRQPERLILFYGNGARKFWGRGLTQEEYGYVLQLEFGADVLVEFGDLVSHVDYFVSFLPEGNIALVSEPLVKNEQLAEAAVDLLIGYLPPQELPRTLELTRILELSAEEFSGQRKSIRKQFDELRKSRLELPDDVELVRKVQEYVDAHCPDDPQECLSPIGQERLLRNEPALFDHSVTASIMRYSAELLGPRLLSIIESQLDGFKPSLAGKVEPKVRELEKLGFKVVRVPRISGDPNLAPPWPGISYVNSLLVDRMLFVPRFGLGRVEDEILAGLQAAIPGYQVVPVYARHLLLRNGGLHCISGIVRVPAGDAPPG